MSTIFLNTLNENGWIEVKEDWEYRKNDWFILRDTGSWWTVGTTTNSRVFDVPEPNGNERWAVNLIEHLCKCDDGLNQLKNKISN